MEAREGGEDTKDDKENNGVNKPSAGSGVGEIEVREVSKRICYEDVSEISKRICYEDVNEISQVSRWEFGR